MNNKIRFPFVMTGVLVLGLSAPVALLAQNRQDQVHPDAAGPAAQSLAVYRPAVQFVHGAVTAGHPLASTAGLRILLQGGNAADASGGHLVDAACRETPELGYWWQRVLHDLRQGDRFASTRWARPVLPLWRSTQRR